MSSCTTLCIFFLNDQSLKNAQGSAKYIIEDCLICFTSRLLGEHLGNYESCLPYKTFYMFFKRWIIPIGVLGTWKIFPDIPSTKTPSGHIHLKKNYILKTQYQRQHVTIYHRQFVIYLFLMKNTALNITIQFFWILKNTIN